MPANSKSRKEIEKSRKREEMLLAAQRCFANKGYHECTMEDIANEYQCAVGSLYSFFSSKNQIYREIFAMKAERYIEFREKLNLNFNEPESAISDYVLARLEYGIADQDFLKLFLRNRFSENFDDESMWKEIFWPSIQNLKNDLEKLFIAGIEKGVFRDNLPVESLTRTVDYNIFRVFEEICLNSCPVEVEERPLEWHRDFILDIIFNGIKK